MKLKNALVALTALGVFASPLAAQAGTTASAAAGKITNVPGMGVRQSTVVRSKQKADGAIVALAVVGAAAGGYGLYEAVKDDKSNGS